MNPALTIAATLDHHLSSPTEIVVFGSAAELDAAAQSAHVPEVYREIFPAARRAIIAVIETTHAELNSHAKNNE